VDTGFPKRSCANKKLERDDDSSRFRNFREEWTAIELRPDRTT
jgi:hypothetical protein